MPAIASPLHVGILIRIPCMRECSACTWTTSVRSTAPGIATRHVAHPPSTTGENQAEYMDWTPPRLQEHKLDEVPDETGTEAPSKAWTDAHKPRGATGTRTAAKEP